MHRLENDLWPNVIYLTYNSEAYEKIQEQENVHVVTKNWATKQMAHIFKVHIAMRSKTKICIPGIWHHIMDVAVEVFCQYSLANPPSSGVQSVVKKNALIILSSLPDYLKIAFLSHFIISSPVFFTFVLYSQDLGKLQQT